MKRKKKVKMSCLTVESENVKPGPEVIKHFSCSTKLRLKFILLMNVKMPTSILTFISWKNDWLSLFEPENSIDFWPFQ